MRLAVLILAIAAVNVTVMISALCIAELDPEDDYEEVGEDGTEV